MHTITLYPGLNVHKHSITVAIAEAALKGEIRLFGAIANSTQAIERLLNLLRKVHSDAQLEVAYEAGPCGLGIARHLKQLDVPCLVAAPSPILNNRVLLSKPTSVTLAPSPASCAPGN